MTAQQEVTPAWQNYLDLQNDVKGWGQIPITDTTRDIQLQLLIDMACTWVQNYLGRPIAPTTFFRRFSGWTNWNGAYVTLPYSPVLKIGPVVEFWGSSGPHTLTEQTPESQGGSDMYQMDYLRGTVIRTYTGLVQRPWFPGSRNIEITWTAGYNPVPADIKIATLELIHHWWERTQQASRRPVAAGFEGHQPGALSGAAILGDITPQLQPYVQVGIG